MNLKINTSMGSIEVSNEVIASIVGGTVIDVYGVVGMVSKNQIKDNLNEILHKENYSKGVIVKQNDNDVIIDIYIIVSYGVKISEVSKNVQCKVKYNLEKLLDIKTNFVNVFIHGLKVNKKN